MVDYKNVFSRMVMEVFKNKHLGWNKIKYYVII